VQTGSTQACALFGGLPLPPEPPGFLASLTAVETGVGSIHCPWVIEAQSGQKVNITLYSFSASTLDQRMGRQSPASSTGLLHHASGLGLGLDNCDWTVVLQEVNKTVQLSGCLDAAREKLVYTSVGGSLRIHVQTTPIVVLTQTAHLLLRYQGIQRIYPHIYYM